MRARPPFPSSGNALFIILIAVALFAALSYAVTQSGRGSGGADKERNLLVAASLVQFGSFMQSVAARMVLTGNSVNDVTAMNGLAPCSAGAGCYFAPEGGGATLISIPSDAVEGSPIWLFTGVGSDDTAFVADNIDVEGVGSSAPELLLMILSGAAGVGIKEDICKEINKRLGLGTTIPANSDTASFLLNDWTIDAFPGEPVGCFEQPMLPGTYVYYHVLYQQ